MADEGYQAIVSLGLHHRWVRAQPPDVALELHHGRRVAPGRRREDPGNALDQGRRRALRATPLRPAHGVSADEPSTYGGGRRTLDLDNNLRNRF